MASNLSEADIVRRLKLEMERVQVADFSSRGANSADGSVNLRVRPDGAPFYVYFHTTGAGSSVPPADLVKLYDSLTPRVNAARRYLAAKAELEASTNA